MDLALKFGGVVLNWAVKDYLEGVALRDYMVLGSTFLSVQSLFRGVRFLSCKDLVARTTLLVESWEAFRALASFPF